MHFEATRCTVTTIKAVHKMALRRPSNIFYEEKAKIDNKLRAAIFIYIEPDPSAYYAGCTVLFKKTLSRYFENRHKPTYKKSIFMMEFYNRLSDDMCAKIIFLLRIELVKSPFSF